MKPNDGGLDGRGALSRRQFMWLTGLAAAGVAAGCATNPVTGSTQFMTVSEEEEIQIDRQYSPMQFSDDYGPVQDAALNAYVSGVGRAVASRSHRPNMPYSFRVVNATYINAYAFPGGSIACTRGIVAGLNDEAELAALLGHEIGHVNARHTAEQMSKGTVSNILVGGLSIIADVAAPGLGQVASALGGFGAGAFLASYSRDNERQADALGTDAQQPEQIQAELHRAHVLHPPHERGTLPDRRECRAHHVCLLQGAAALPRALHGQHRAAALHQGRHR
jgi:predicted Zn-dependent protease